MFQVVLESIDADGTEIDNLRVTHSSFDEPGTIKMFPADEALTPLELFLCRGSPEDDPESVENGPNQQ